MSIDKMIESLNKMRDIVGGSQEVAVMVMNHGENDYIVPEYPIVGDFEDQDSMQFKCAFVGRAGGEEFTAKGIPHYEWDPLSFKV